MSQAADAWLELFGRLHPLVLHLPIGLLAGLAALEVIAVIRRSPIPRDITRMLVLLTSLATLLAAATGYTLGREDSLTGTTFLRHQQLGIALAITCAFTAVVHWTSTSVRAYRVALLLTLALLIPVGHLGGAMTHGEAFLTAPLARVLRTTASALDPGGEPATLLARQDAPTRLDIEPAAIVAVHDSPDPSVTPSVAPAVAPDAAPVVARADEQSALEPISKPVWDRLPAGRISGFRDGLLVSEAFALRVQPIFAGACIDCHGSERQKGGLGLHSLTALSAGGRSGAVFVPGSPDQSELVRRLRLPMHDKKRMPPANKPQLTDEQIVAIEAWIAAAAPAAAEPSTPPVSPADRTLVLARADVEPSESVSPSAAANAAAIDAPPATDASPQPAPAEALHALREHLVHVEAAAEGSDLLSISFAAAAAQTDDTLAKRLLEPLLPNLDRLSLSQSRVTDETAALLAGAKRLRRLDLRGTQVTDAGVESLRELALLEELVLARTQVGADAVEHLARMPALQRVFVWQTALTPEAVASLTARKPGLHVDTGNFVAAVAREVEPDITLTSDAPLPGEPPKPVAAASAADLTPVNTTCPVSGGPVDPRYAVVYKNRVIGFCCPKCPGQFWADPAKFESNLPAAPAVAAAGAR